MRDTVSAIQYMLKKASPVFSLLTILFFCSAFPSMAQLPWANYYPMEEIASTGRYKDIVIDSQDRLWISTDHGIHMYDGHRFHAYKDATQSNYVKSLLKGEKDSIYIVDDGGLELLTFENNMPVFDNLLKAKGVFSDTTLNYPKTLYQSKNKDLWIGEDSTIVRYRDGKMKRYELGQNWQSRNYITSHSFQEDGYGNFWVFSFIGHIHRYVPSADTFVRVTLPHDLRVLSFSYKMEVNVFWLGTAEGVYEIEVNAAGEVIRSELIVNIRNVSCLHFVSADYLLIGTWSQGLFMGYRNQGTFLFKKLDLPKINDVITIKKRNNKQFWIVGSETIGALNISPFVYYQIDSDYNLIRSVHPVNDKKVLAATDFKITELQRLDGQWQAENEYNIEGLYFFRAIPFKGLYILGDQLGQLHVFNPGNSNLERLNKIPQGEAIQWMYQDIDEKLWICGNKRAGLVRMDSNFNVRSYASEGLRDIRVIRCGKDGECYAAGDLSENQLAHFNFRKEAFDLIDLDFDPRPDEQFAIEDLFIGRDSIYLATNMGLYVLSKKAGFPKKAVRIHLPGLQADITLKAINRTPDGAFWLAGETMVMRYNGKEVQCFDHSNGLPSGALHFRGIELDKEGDLWLATEKGLAMLPEYEKLNHRSTTPEVLITEWGTENQFESSEGVIENTFHYGSNLEFKFLSKMFPSDLVTFQTRILEIDTGWSNMDPENNLKALNFKDGNYTFELRAGYKGMLRSKISSKTFTVSKPWFKSVWFLSAMFFMLLSLVWIVYAVLKKRIELKKIRTIAEVQTQNEEELESFKQLIQQEKGQSEKLKSQITKIKSQFDTEKSILNTEIKYRDLKMHKYTEDIELKNKQLSTQLLRGIEKDRALQKVHTELKKLLKKSPDHMQEMISPLLKTIEHNKVSDKDWEAFRFYFEGVHRGFDEKLTSNFPLLTAQDLRHCALIRSKLNINECANLLGISPDSVKTSRYRLKKKLQLGPQQSLLDFLMTI